MKYKAKSTMCGCGNPRRPGGRYCNACHAAAQKKARGQASGADATETVRRALVRVVHVQTARKCGKRLRKLDPKFEAALRTMAERVAGEIEAFNLAGAN